MNRCSLLLALVALAGCARDVKVDPTRGELRPGDPFPHELWTRVLQRVNKAGFVDYRALAQDHADLDEYLGWIAKYSPESNPDLFPEREDRLAWGINSYNAFVMKGVLDHYPISSVKDVGSVPEGFFIQFAYPAGKDTWTLAHAESWVRGFGDPRVHFALNCASIGCPRLPEEAFVPARLEEQLEQETKKFIGDERNVRRQDGKVLLSKIFKWYAGDFKAWLKAHGKREDVLEYVRLAGKEIPDSPIEFVDYDWSLNDQR
ncbi:MAG: DUF547 domain-containing protein [Planctomycetes bacterium]|nr:DUF547 domain-containing protein [Planctomycetota bacterium]